MGVISRVSRPSRQSQSRPAANESHSMAWIYRQHGPGSQPFHYILPATYADGLGWYGAAPLALRDGGIRLALSAS